MATNLAIDDDLIREAKSVGHHKTNKEAVTAALQEYVERHNQTKIMDLFGKIDYDENYEHKKVRNFK